uniref:non-specific serine/threonine protein kinase n=1 Tax=Alexandrium catenella TaxID=2925 RepID=A0A7S1L6N3_ALECA
MTSFAASLLLALHFLTFGAQLLALDIFWQTGNTNSFVISLATLLVTGSFFSDAVWRGALWRPRGHSILPIKRLPCLPKVFCCCPLIFVCGCLQGVMVPLTLQQAQVGDGSVRVHGPAMTIFHGKGVNGLFEGIVCSGVLLHAYLGIAFPEGSPHPVTHDPAEAVYPLKFLGMSQILRVAGIISFASGGLGILNMDFCLCMKLGAYIHSGSNPRMRLFRHWLFRTSELVSRVSLHVIFFLFADEYLPAWRWFPGTMSIFFSVVMIYVFGGSEASSLVIWVCGFLCTFVDAFRFLDFPDKRRAARTLSKILACRYVVELVYMPVLLVLLIGFLKPGDHQGLGAGLDKVREYLHCLWHAHPVVLLPTVVAFPLYFCLLVSIGVQRFLEQGRDLFSACDLLDVAEVRRFALGPICVNVDMQDNEGRTPLVRALQSALTDDDKCADICKILINGGASIDMKAPAERIWIRRWFRPVARFCWTPLHVAAHRGSSTVLRALLRGYTTDKPVKVFGDLAGNTPLHVAMIYRKAEAAKLLAASFPGWLEAKNFKEKTPRDLASTTALQQALESPALLPGGPSDPSMTQEPWAVEEHRVARATREGLLRAPGLASFAVALAGGPAVGSVLRLIAEDAEDAEDPAPAQRAPPAVVPAMIPAEELEPIAKDGSAPLPEWEALHRAGLPPPDVADSIARISCTRGSGFCWRAVLGQGAYGVVWLARRRGDQGGERYAVKNVRGRAQVARREQDMCREVRVMPHPNLAKLYGIQEFPDAALSVLIMEFVPGGDLLRAIRAGWPERMGRGAGYAAPPETLPWLGQIFLALEHLHLGMHVLLRDLKPENVVLDARRRAKLIDLGLGRLGTESDGCFTLQDMPPGTPGYCAPEVLKKESYNEKADLYSFGVTAWMVLTGGIPSHRRDPEAPTNFDRRSIRSCYEDCELLHRYIDYPEQHGVSKLEEGEAYTFVTSLTASLPSGRPDHSEIRMHSLFADGLRVPLPERSAGCNGVESWLQELGFR